ncbi:MAG TPA: DnaA/Hda family protein, partial [Bradyrhizobium sp.]|nr:DnaA/Hda family protein [Bradyrhizobium sp.]
MTTTTEQERWTRVKNRLRAEVGEEIFQSWFARMELERIHEGMAHLSVPTRFLKSWIQSHYSDRLLTCWQSEHPDLQKLEITVRSAVLRTVAPKAKPIESIDFGRDARGTRGDSGETRTAFGPVASGHDALGGSPLDLRLTFDTFVIGRSNTLAHAAAKQVAAARRNDPVMFNPLYIHAGVGLGKTHLLQAITWAGNNGSERKVLYLTAEKFMYGF